MSLLKVTRAKAPGHKDASKVNDQFGISLFTAPINNRRSRENIGYGQEGSLAIDELLRN